MSTSLPARAGRRCHNALNLLHSAVYFSPDLGTELGSLGLGHPSDVYFASRAAAMGPVGAAVVTSTFYNFNHELVGRHVPQIWRTAEPEAVLTARMRAVDTTLRRLLGDEAVASAEMAESAELALRAVEACTRPARPLYAAHADLPVPEQPHLAFWHAATLLREHRGDGHIVVLMAAELDALEAIVSHSASGKGQAAKWLLRTRGWSQDDWTAAEDRLRERGLMDAEGGLSETGTELRRQLETDTDRLDRAPYEHLGEAGVARLTELANGWLTTAFAAGAFPADLFGQA
ncbi:SCO6745 family protein [Streptomyces sp. 8N706]|uniref:SCO6745 family protein n=1 Tax=Streptomyces sp. 8N706 TaxID=3457416 RepID=UPI003FD2F147